MHIPVLERELLDFLMPARGDNFIDCTLGEGGHAESLLKKTALRNKSIAYGGKLIGIEWDKNLAEVARNNLSQFGKRTIIINDSYANLAKIFVDSQFPLTIKGIYFDLGVCLWHYRKAERGFSFRKAEPLDMRFSTNILNKACDIVNRQGVSEIEKILRDYGEISRAHEIAQAIVVSRRQHLIQTTQDLTSLINDLPASLKNREKNLIRKVFQALRIAVNQELDNLQRGLKQAVDILANNGIIAVISYHSLEDRIVKRFFENHHQLKIITQKPIKPSLLERRFNPSARSAKLRVAIKHSL